MKRNLLIIAVLILSFQLFSQETEEPINVQQKDNDEIKTLLGDVNSYGLYLGLTLNYSVLNNENAMFIGGKGALVIGHGLAIGLAGYGFSNDYKWNPVMKQNVNLEGGYGGFYIEPIIFPKFPIHIALPVFVGVGGISYMGDNYYSYDDWENYVEDNDAFVLIEPGVEMEMNLVRFLRVSIGASYRYSSDIRLMNVKSDVLNGLSTGITFKFGGF
ncbi:MAG: hypothetical protein ABIJ97_16865 [Bacteroidota bacterium]